MSIMLSDLQVAHLLSGMSLEDFEKSFLIQDRDYMSVVNIAMNIIRDGEFEELVHRGADQTTQPVNLFQKLLALSTNIRKNTFGLWMIVDAWNPIFGKWFMVFDTYEQHSSGIFYQPEKL
jgi:hypothetical protein